MIQEVIDRVSGLNRTIAEVDVNHIWKYGQANRPALEAEIAAAEARLGQPLCPGYRTFLEHADGWNGFYHDVNLFSCAELLAGGKVERAWDIVEVADAGSGGLLDANRARYLPVGAAEFDIDVFLVDLASESGSVRWIAGEEIETFPSFEDFLVGMAQYSEETLSALREDPWLGSRPR